MDNLSHSGDENSKDGKEVPSYLSLQRSSGDHDTGLKQSDFISHPHHGQDFAHQINFTNALPPHYQQDYRHADASHLSMSSDSALHQSLDKSGSFTIGASFSEGSPGAKKKSRGSYKCSKCGQPKKGHSCASSSPESGKAGSTQTIAEGVIEPRALTAESQLGLEELIVQQRNEIHALRTENATLRNENMTLKQMLENMSRVPMINSSSHLRDSINSGGSEKKRKREEVIEEEHHGHVPSQLPPLNPNHLGHRDQSQFSHMNQQSSLKQEHVSSET